MAHHEHLNRLGRAAADNDAMAEEVGIEEAMKRIGLDVHDMMYVAEQRAMRVVMSKAGMTIPSRPTAIKFTAAQKQEMATLTALVLDGIAIGWRAHKELTD